MPVSANLGQARYFRWLAIVAGLGVLLYFVPLFHVVPLKAARQQSAMLQFDAADYIDTFWQGPLREAASVAIDVEELLAAFEQDFAATAQRFGHRLGLSGSASYLVSGQGRITAIENESIAISLRNGASPDIVIETGPLFSNAIRDGSGLLDVSDFANTQDYNALSAEINRRVEEQVLPALVANAAVGKAVRFVGGVEVADAARAPASLLLVPISIEFP